MKPTDKGPFTGPYLVQTPAPMLEALLQKFDGRRTKKTFAAAKRMQRPGTIRVPRNLMNQVWFLTGGWEELSKTFFTPAFTRADFPILRLAAHYHGRNAGTDQNPVPWRDRSLGLAIGGLELCFVPTSDGPELFLRWQGWIFGSVPAQRWRGAAGSQNWKDRRRAEDAVSTMCHRLSAPEADAWGFMTRAEIEEEIRRKKK